MIEVQTLPLRAHLVAEFGDAIVKARKRDGPGCVIMQPGKYLG